MERRQTGATIESPGMNLSPTEAAARFGVSIKALRLSSSAAC